MPLPKHLVIKMANAESYVQSIALTNVSIAATELTNSGIRSNLTYDMKLAFYSTYILR